MAISVLKTLFALIVFLFYCGLQVDCKAEKYAFSVVENGTTFKEEVEVDEEDKTEVIRVPRHNHVDAVEIMNDFISALSVRRDPVRKACYVSKLDSSFPSPGKMKLDMDQASRQSSMPDEVTTTRTAWKVVGFANRSALSQKILKFCGIFPIYEIEIEESGIPLEIFNIPQRQASGRVRIKRQTDIQFKLCSKYEHQTLEACVRKVGHIDLDYNCKVDQIYCYYIAKCDHHGGLSYTCYRVDHYAYYVGLCCTPSC